LQGTKTATLSSVSAIGSARTRSTKLRKLYSERWR
jgi:hypothetical protein